MIQPINQTNQLHPTCLCSAHLNSSYWQQCVFSFQNLCSFSVWNRISNKTIKSSWGCDKSYQQWKCIPHGPEKLENSPPHISAFPFVSFFLGSCRPPAVLPPTETRKKKVWNLFRAAMSRENRRDTECVFTGYKLTSRLRKKKSFF